MAWQRKRALLVAAVPVLATSLAIVWHVWPARSHTTGSFPGMVRTTEIRIAPEVSGRMARFLVMPGKAVLQGQPVAAIVNPELFAAVDAARAQLDKARSDRDRIYAGVRAEEVQALEREIAKAQAVHTQDQQELVRKSTLAAHSYASQQELDIAKAAEARSAADIAVAQGHYAEALRGPTDEEKALADATVAAAEAALDVIEAGAAKMLLRAPQSGTIATLVAEPGEAVVPGEPVLTMIPDSGLWFGFDLREDRLRGLTIGASVSLRDASNQMIPAKVVELRDWGAFAVWRAARATGDHDLNTFFVRLDTVGPAAGLRAGQTVWLTPPAQ
ncbi:MAG TPA: HlyD family efflux transporter periplasmic adaptor subunit [Acetobacteraceae bacterium]|nr:HlyD family efflux transporter periplasmic adaptor subunit [Acetobacteraceae bacterium]